MHRADRQAAPRRAQTRVQDALVDPRVARHGGTRRNLKHTYDFPGMAADRDWRETDAHEHTRWYGCARCATKFSGPHAVYTHLAKVHGR